MIYLASPYSDPDPVVRWSRYEAVCRHAAHMLRDGHLVYSPVVHGHALAQRGLPGDWAYWERHNREMLRRCDALLVLTLPGWETSRGVQAEVALARALGLPVHHELSAEAPSEVSR